MGNYNYQILSWPAQPRSKKRREANITAGGSLPSIGSGGVPDMDLSGYIRIADLIKTTWEEESYEYLDTNVLSSLMVKSFLDQKANSIHDHRNQLLRPAVFVIPKLSPTESGISLDDGEDALWLGSTGSYAEVPSGGGGTVYDLTIRRGSVSIGTFNLGEMAANIDLAPLFAGYAFASQIPTALSALSDDSTHRLVTDTEKEIWSAKLGSLPVASLTTLGGVIVGNGLSINSSGVLSVTGVGSDYLPLTGGTLSNTAREILVINSSNASGGWLAFKKNTTVQSLIGMNPLEAFGVFITNHQANRAILLGNDGELYWSLNAENIPKSRKIWHSGNLVKISQLNNDSGYITNVALAGYLPITGGTITGNLSVTGISSLAALEVSGSLTIPTSAPSNPDTSKVYLWCDTSGSFVVN